MDVQQQEQVDSYLAITSEVMRTLAGSDVVEHTPELKLATAQLCASMAQVVLLQSIEQKQVRILEELSAIKWVT